MHMLLTESLSALRYSAQEPWRDDQTLKGGSKALGIVAGPDRLRVLHALAWYIIRHRVFGFYSGHGRLNPTEVLLSSRDRTQNGYCEVFRFEWAWAQCPNVCKDGSRSLRHLARISSRNRIVQYFSASSSVPLSWPEIGRDGILL